MRSSCRATRSICRTSTPRRSATLDRFIQLHPAHRDVAYAYYLRALCYYEQIADIQRDQKGTQQAMDALQEVVNRFPDSAYARDARLKIDLCRDHLAGKEMEIGRWYESQHLYEAAIGRFQRVVDDYQTTNHVPEALHRLTEIYLILGLRDRGAEDRVGARLQLSRQRVVRGQLQRPVRRRPGAAAPVPTDAGRTTAGSSRAPGTRSSEPRRQQGRRMLTALSIRDVVLIERLDLSFGPGLTVLTGETGAGKSILLDSLGLALGARADAGLVRTGAEQASVTACFAPPAGHPLTALLSRTGAGGGGRGRAAPRGRPGWPLARVRQRPAGRRRAAAPCRGAAGRGAGPARADRVSPSRRATRGLLDAFGVPRPLREATQRWPGARGARRLRRWRRRAKRSPRRNAMRSGCATRWTSWPVSRPSRRRRSGWRRAAAAAAGRASGRGDRRGAGRADAARSAQSGARRRRCGRRAARCSG